MTDIKGEIVEQTVEVEITIDAPVETVFDYFVVPEKLARWLGPGAGVDPRPGGRFRAGLSDDDVASGTYIDVERPKRVSFSWGWEGSEIVPPGASVVEITLEEVGGATTVVRVSHKGLPDDQPGSHLEGWLHYLGVLGTVALP
ncbi:MAG: SRPBCC domain-containing protein [Acidimicrobiia bacterium]|nr:SRPBCC domain-containing protein [Acidimicrobiia bacterium]